MLSIYKIIINLLNIIAYIWWFCLKLVKSYKFYLNDMAVWNELGIVLVGKNGDKCMGQYKNIGGTISCVNGYRRFSVIQTAFYK